MKIEAVGRAANIVRFEEKEIKTLFQVTVRQVLDLDKTNEKRIIVLVNKKPATLETEVTDIDKVVMLVIGEG